MILDEPILKTFVLEYRSELLKDWQDAYLHMTGAFEYHVTEGYWILFESEGHYATVGYDGVKTYEKPYEFPKEKYVWYYDGDEELTDHVDTIFSGQRIHSLRNFGEYKSIIFDSFELNLYVYGENDAFYDGSGTAFDGVSVMAVGSHLLNKCECGGEGELLLDERGDFAARCKRCHKATYFDMELKARIEAWNRGERKCYIDTGREKLTAVLKEGSKIRYLALPPTEEKADILSGKPCRFATLIIALGDSLFLLSTKKSAARSYDFTGLSISNYNPDFYPTRIEPEKRLSFIREEELDGRKAIRFDLDGAPLLLEATPNGIFAFAGE